MDGGLDALMRVRRLSIDADELVLELRTASALMTRLDRPEDALFVLDGALEREPANEAARDLAWTIVGSASPASARARAGNLLEARALRSMRRTRRECCSRSSSMPREIAPETPKDAWAELGNVRRAWFERLLELSEGEDVLAVAERAAGRIPGARNNLANGGGAGVLQG